MDNKPLTMHVAVGPAMSDEDIMLIRGLLLVMYNHTREMTISIARYATISLLGALMAMECSPDQTEEYCNIVKKFLLKLYDSDRGGGKQGGDVHEYAN